MSLIEELGPEITWEILGTDGGWCVWACHRGSDDPDDNFKFTACEPTLARALAIVGAGLITEGPDWVRKA